jgi:hypothetical protein
VTTPQAGQSALSLDREQSKDDRVTKPMQNQDSLSLDRQNLKMAQGRVELPTLGL